MKVEHPKELKEEHIRFNTTLFEELRNLYKCPICLDLLEKPITTLCGHTFCSECINQYLSQNYKKLICPSCATPIQKREFRIHAAYNNIGIIIKNVIDQNSKTKTEGNYLRRDLSTYPDANKTKLPQKFQIHIDGSLDRIKAKPKGNISDNSLLENFSRKDSNFLNHTFSMATQDHINSGVEKNPFTNDFATMNSNPNAIGHVSKEKKLKLHQTKKSINLENNLDSEKEQMLLEENIPKTSSSKLYIILSVGLNSNEHKILEKFCSKFNHKFVSTFNITCNLVITKLDKHEIKTNQKILTAILSHKDIVSYKWLEESLSEEVEKPIKEYFIINNILLQKYPQGIFSEFTIYCCFFDRKKLIKQEMIEQLIIYGKGVILRSLKQVRRYAKKEEYKGKLLIIGNKPFNSDLIQTNIPHLHYEWILDSIIEMKIKKFTRYFL